jgi:hypothetical protein
MTTSISIDPATERNMRALRLWHYKQMTTNRELAKNAVATMTGQKYSLAADTHLKFVQHLNDFFPAGDDAENDARPAP